MCYLTIHYIRRDNVIKIEPETRAKMVPLAGNNVAC